MACVDCEFKLKDCNKVFPVWVLANLFDICQYLNEYDDYHISYYADSIHFGILDRYLPLREDLPQVLEKNVLGRGHLKAFFWLKRNTNYTGSSHNVNDWDRHPEDFFGEVEDMIRTYARRS